MTKTSRGPRVSCALCATGVMLAGGQAMASVHVAYAKQSTLIRMWFEPRPGETQSVQQMVTPTSGYAFAHMYSIQTGNVDPQLHCVGYEGEAGSPVLDVNASPSHAIDGRARFISAPRSSYIDYHNRLQWGSLTEAIGTTNPILFAEASGASGAMGYEIGGAVTLIITGETDISVFNDDVPSYIQSIWQECPDDDATGLSNSSDTAYSIAQISVGAETFLLGTIASEDETYTFMGYDSVDDQADPVVGTFDRTIDFDDGQTAEIGSVAFSVNGEAADVDGDDVLDCDDLLELRQGVSTGGGALTDDESVANYDFNGDSQVDAADLLLLRLLFDDVLDVCTTGDSGDDGVLGVCDLYALRDVISGGSVDDSDPDYVVSLDMDLDGDLDSTDESLLEDLLMSEEIYQLGDLDGDYDVDVFDYSIFASNFGMMSGATLWDGDLDGDGDVDVLDFGIFQSYFGNWDDAC